MNAHTTEICVIGGGPAGAVAAYRLAQLGHSVMLVGRRTRPRLRTIESLSPSVLRLLEFLDLTGYVDECLRVRALGTAIRWQDTVPQFRAEGDHTPFLVDRNQFDEALLIAAKEAGVQILRSGVACRPRSTDEGWEIEIRGCDEGQVIRAEFLVIASGRNSSFARPRQQLLPSTSALVSYWRNCLMGDPVMCVDVGNDFWCWGCRLPNGTGHTIVFVDRSDCPVRGFRDSNVFWSRVLTEAPLLAKCVNGEPVGKVATYDATAYQTNSFVNSHYICIGDAAVTLDPLSSQGVQNALSTALQGSLVAHTILSVPANKTAAIEFYESRIRELATRHVRLATKLYAQQRIYPSADFWRYRSCVDSLVVADTKDMPAHRYTVERLTLTSLYRVSDEAQIVDIPAATGDIISPQPSLVHPALDRAITYMVGLPIAPILSAFGKGGALATDVINHLATTHSRQKYEQVVQFLAKKAILLPTRCC